MFSAERQEKENKRNIQSLCDILFGIVDLSSFLLMILPLYPKTVDNYIYSVNLFAYTEVSARNRWIYWILFSGLILTGALKLLMVQLKIEKMQKSLLICSLFLSSAAVIVLALAGETYAVTAVFLLLLIKGSVLGKYLKSGS